MSKPFNAVLLVDVPENWKPDRVFHLPPAVTNPRFYATRVPLNIAIEIARAFNAERLKCCPDGNIGSWALQIRALKTRTYGHPDSRQTPRDPASKRSTTVKGGLGI